MSSYISNFTLVIHLSTCIYPLVITHPLVIPSEAGNLGFTGKHHKPTLAPIPPPLNTSHPATQKNIAHVSSKLFRIRVDARIMPGINPIHHAEKAKYSNAG